MTSKLDEPASPSPDEPDRRADRVTLWGSLVIVSLAAGWFAMSHWIMETALFEAAGEALGVTFGLLVLASIIGAVLSTRGKHR